MIKYIKGLKILSFLLVLLAFTSAFKSYESNKTVASKNGECSYCNGSGSCSNCDGAGKVDCRNCNGTGTITDQYNVHWDAASGTYIAKTTRCTSCSGSGRVRCSSCNGTGKCNHCHGTGKSPY